MRIYILLLAALMVVAPAFGQKSKKSKSAPKLYERGTKAITANLSEFNTVGYDFAPAFYQKGIVFVSKSGLTDTKNQSGLRDMYYSEIAADGKLLPALPFTIRVETQRFEGSVAFNKEGTALYFCHRTDDGSNTRLRMFEAIKGERDWQQPRELPFNSDGFSVCHPSLSTDGQILYFSSDMPGGFGGFDLYKSVKKADGTWAAAENLGKTINSEKNEGFPYVHPTGTLFFSSNGHDSRGGMDVFMATTAENGNIEISAMFAPINSKGDDYGLILNEAGTAGFFVSDRNGGKGADDLYMFQVSGTVEQISAAEAVIAVKTTTDGKPLGEVAMHFIELDATGQPEMSAKYYNVWLKTNTDGTCNLISNRKHTSALSTETYTRDTDGGTRQALKAGRDYLIEAYKPGFKPFSRIVYLPDTLEDDMPLIIKMDAEPEKEAMIDEEIPFNAGCYVIISDVDYEFRQSAIQTGSTLELDKLIVLLRKNSNIDVEIAAHTDTRGPTDYNLRLSQQRADNAKRYLEAYGIASSRITAIGKGEAAPLNKCTDGATCSEQEHLANRRLEVRFKNR